MFLFQVNEDCSNDACADLDALNLIANELKKHGFDLVEMTGGRALFNESRGWPRFKAVVEYMSFMHNINVIQITACDDPGIGLENE